MWLSHQKMCIVEQNYNLYLVRIVCMSAKKLKEPLLEQNEAASQYVTIGFVEQIKLLTYKNMLITFKNPKNIIFLIITPFLLSIFLYGFQSLAVDNGNLVIPDPSSSPLPAYPQCGWSDCISVDLRLAASVSTAKISDYAWIQTIADELTKQGYSMNKQAQSQVITNFDGLTKYYDYLEQNQNRTQAGLLFCGEPVANFSNFCPPGKDYTYYLVLKKLNTMATIFHAINEPFPLDLKASALKNFVDNLILNYELNQQLKPAATIDIQSSRFPLGPNRYIQNYDIITAIGAFYFMITPLFVFLFIQNEIVREKQYRLRQGLNIFGASHTAYWVSWFLITIIYSLICSVSCFLAGYAFGFGFFTQTPFYIIIFLLLFPFNLALSMIGFLVATIASNSKASNTASYAIVLLAIVVQSFVSDNNLLTFIFTTNASTLVQLLRAFLVIYPPFSYTKIFTNITIYSGFHFDINQRSWIAGPKPYDMDIFTTVTKGPLPFGGGTFERYSDLTSMFILYGNAALYAVLAWYFDNVISSNRGRGQSLFFPIKRIWKLISKRIGSKNEQKASMVNLKARAYGQGAQESAIKQRNRVYQNSQKNIPALGLRIKCLSKTFKGACSKEEVRALNELSVEIEPNELMAVLGHNGAGKTTLINILTGILDPDELQETQIIINRENINNIDQIRKHIGLCAQFDILWNQLTAEQHLDLFAQLKGVPKHERKLKIQELLDMVSLGREGKNEVRGFSGGMRRRLSLAIAAIGDPKIILLDEPTTGLDPKVRQQVWKLIEKMKKTRSIILTTHSMEEADVLSDRVCVMVKGRIKCIGTTVFLKQEYGLGHRLTLNIDKKQVTLVQDTLKKICPSAVMVDYKGGNLVVGIDQFQNLLKVIKMLESKESYGLEQYDLKKSIRDWNVSDATLQEVFMAVSKQRHD